VQKRGPPTWWTSCVPTREDHERGPPTWWTSCVPTREDHEIGLAVCLWLDPRYA
jgi:hypothetical protein